MFKSAEFAPLLSERSDWAMTKVVLIEMNVHQPRRFQKWLHILPFFLLEVHLLVHPFHGRTLCIRSFAYCNRSCLISFCSLKVLVSFLASLLSFTVSLACWLFFSSDNSLYPWLIFNLSHSLGFQVYVLCGEDEDVFLVLDAERNGS